MASRMTDASPQQTGKKGMDKTKDMMILVEDRLVEFTTTMSIVQPNG